jgi:hypothetical protein
MKHSINQKFNYFTAGNRLAKSIPCEIIKGLKPGIYTSFNMAAKANRIDRKTLFDIAKGKFKRDGIEVSPLDIL